MVKLDVKINAKQVVASVSKFSVDINQKALVRAVNKTAAQAKVEASREIRTAGYNIKASIIKKAIKVKKATAKTLTAVVSTSGKRIGLIHYGARKVKGGVSVQVKNGRKILQHAFIIQTKSGHVGVFERYGASRTKGSKMKVDGRLVRANLPIRELFGPSIPAAMGNTIVNAAVMRKIKEKFPAILARELNYIKLTK